MAKIIFGFLTVIGAALVHLSFGYNYSIGNMNPYLIAYLGIKKSDSVWFKGVLLAGQAIGMPIGGFLASKIGFRLVTIFGCVLTSGGVLLSYFAINANFGAMIATYSVMFGLGMGLPYSVLFAIASAWFPKHRALVVGIIASGLGLGSLVFSPIQTALINPTNIGDLSSPQVKDNVPRAFLILGGTMAAIQVLGFCLLRECKDPDADVPNTKPLNDSEKEESVVSKSSTEEKNGEIAPISVIRNYAIHEAVKSVDFYILWIIVFCNVIPVTLLSATFKVYGKDAHLDDRYLSIIATLSSAFNCVGRICWGLICDKFSFKCPLGWLLIQWALFFATFPFIQFASSAKVLYAIWVFALFFTMSGHFVLMPAACTRTFGPKHMATIYGLLYFATAPSSLILSAIISQFEITGKWNYVYLSCAAVLLVSFILSTLLIDNNGTCTKATNVCAKMCNPCRHPEQHEGRELHAYRVEGDPGTFEAYSSL